MILAGRYTGSKAVIVKNIDGDTTDHTALTTPGINSYPCKVTTTMGKKRTAKRFKIKTFVKVSNTTTSYPPDTKLSWTSLGFLLSSLN